MIPPQAETNLAALLAAWRQGFALPPWQPANEFKAEARPALGERIIAKQMNSTFVGAGLEAMLRA